MFHFIATEFTSGATTRLPVTVHFEWFLYNFMTSTANPCRQYLLVLLCFIVILSLCILRIDVFIDLFSATAARVFNKLTYLLSCVNLYFLELFVFELRTGMKKTNRKTDRQTYCNS